MSTERWKDDKVQFARLICEIVANCPMEGGFERLQESMDLSPDELGELFDRAFEVWESAKAEVMP